MELGGSVERSPGVNGPGVVYSRAAKRQCGKRVCETLSARENAAPRLATVISVRSVLDDVRYLEYSTGGHRAQQLRVHGHTARCSRLFKRLPNDVQAPDAYRGRPSAAKRQPRPSSCMARGPMGRFLQDEGRMHGAGGQLSELRCADRARTSAPCCTLSNQ